MSYLIFNALINYTKN